MKTRPPTRRETRHGTSQETRQEARSSPLAAGLVALAAVTLAAAVAGCQADEATHGGATTGPAPWEQPEVDAEATPSVGPDDLVGGDTAPLGRSVRRMRLDTLQAAMSVVAGTDLDGKPIEWKVNGQNGFSDAAFGKALGRPDYQSTTEESGVSSALYLKFVGDAARDVCTQMAKNDQLRGDASTRALFPKAPVDASATEAQLTENVQYLVLRFLGLRLAATDSVVTSLVAVHAAGEGAAPEGGELSPAAEGWRGVCVTLFESPLFHND